ncbi:hypothetical protein AVEN_255242-1 [Araneus ventricosus]|uniref:RNA-directed DNA polymerase n=1 Tax=Araneus ventricosus TaxID=182803 RepID=A0A4Y2BAP0_ARAVE|nr:hypothetical protein AVEN_255242-1 [Araneus ventricosus]
MIRPIVRQIKDPVPPQTDPWSDKEFRESQMKEPDIKPIIEFMESSSTRPIWQDISSFSPRTKRYWALWNSLQIRNGVLYRKWESEDGKSSKWQLVLPRSRIPDVLKELHSNPKGGHIGVMKIVHNVRQQFFWNKVKEDVQEWCKSCNARKGPKRRSRGKLHDIIQSTIPKNSI